MRFSCYAWNQEALLNWSCDLVKDIPYICFRFDFGIQFKGNVMSTCSVQCINVPFNFI